MAKVGRQRRPVRIRRPGPHRVRHRPTHAGPRVLVAPPGRPPPAGPTLWRGGDYSMSEANWRREARLLSISNTGPSTSVRTFVRHVIGPDTLQLRAKATKLDALAVLGPCPSAEACLDGRARGEPPASSDDLHSPSGAGPGPGARTGE